MIAPTGDFAPASERCIGYSTLPCRCWVLVVWKRPARLAYRADAGEGLAMP